jgi:hypothetical protein
MKAIDPAPDRYLQTMCCFGKISAPNRFSFVRYQTYDFDFDIERRVNTTSGVCHESDIASSVEPQTTAISSK